MANLKITCVGYYFLFDPSKREKTSVREEMRSESEGGEFPAVLHLGGFVWKLEWTGRRRALTCSVWLKTREEERRRENWGNKRVTQSDFFTDCLQKHYPTPYTVNSQFDGRYNAPTCSYIPFRAPVRFSLGSCAICVKKNLQYIEFTLMALKTITLMQNVFNYYA